MQDENSKLSNIHPGEILSEDFLKPLGKTAYWLAKGIRMDQTAVSGIIKGKRSVTPNTALRLAKFLGTHPQFWMNLQIQYDLEEERDKQSDTIKSIKPYNSDVFCVVQEEF